MGLVQYFVALLMLSAHLVISFPATSRTYTMNGRRCRLCPPGEFQASCSECESCPAGQYTAEWNREDGCHRCYGDCSPNSHLKVVQNCSSTTDVKCACEEGFRCIEKVPYTENCRECVRMHDMTTTAAAAAAVTSSTVAAAAVLVVSGQDKQSHSSVSSGQGSDSHEGLCKFPKCDSQSVPVEDTVNPEKTSSSLVVILCSVFGLGFLAFVILFCVRRGDQTCFTQIIAKLCDKEGGDAAQKAMESKHPFPRDSFSTKQQPSTFSAANQGPVHVHNPGTVIFSLLSQFTGQVGPTTHCGSKSERGHGEREEKEETQTDCPVFHPTSPHSVQLSEEERSEEADSMFFPSQEQGKDYHISKEEVL